MNIPSDVKRVFTILFSAPIADRIGFIAILFEHWEQAFFHADGFANEDAAYDAGHTYFFPVHAGIENARDIAYACLAIYETLTTPRENNTSDVVEASINETNWLNTVRTAFYRLSFRNKKLFIVQLLVYMQTYELFKGMTIPEGGLGISDENVLRLLEHMREQGNITDSQFFEFVSEVDGEMPF